jgi:hypothetical protein
MAYEDELSDDVALRNSRQRGYANSTQSAQDMAYEERVAALEAEKKRRALEAATLAQAQAQQIPMVQTTEQALPLSMGQSGSSGNSYAPRQGRSMEYFKKYEDMMNNAPDMTAMNEYAQQRGRQGSSAMLNSLLANSAGENFAPQQAAYLKQAMAARDPLEVSGGMLTNKGFVEDPYAARGEKGKAALAIAKELNDSEQIAQREADADARYERRYGNSSQATPGERLVDSRYINEARKNVESTSGALQNIGVMRSMLDVMPGGIWNPEIGMINSAMASLGFDSAEKKATAFNIANSIASQFGIEKLSQIGGNDTDKELAVSIKTTYGERNTKKANQLLLNLYESIVVANQNKPTELIKWKSKYGSTQNENADGESFDTYWDNYKTKLRKERGLDLGSIKADLQNYTSGSSNQGSSNNQSTSTPSSNGVSEYNPNKVRLKPKSN